METTRPVSNLFVSAAYYFSYSFPGFLWQVRPFPGILQADRNWMAALSQDRGTDILVVYLAI